MKLLKLIFSKFFVIALLFLLQVGLILAGTYFIVERYLAVQIFFGFLAVIAFLTLANKKESPEFKIPWIVLIFLLPFFGISIYVIFSRPRATKKQTERLTLIATSTLKRSNALAANSADMEEFLGKRAGIEQYLYRTSYTSGHLNSDVRYLPSGEDFFASLLLDLKSAKKFIFMEFFIIDYGKMWDAIHSLLIDKVEEGVEVRLIYDDIGATGKLKNNFCKKLRAEGINCVKFNPFRPVISGVFNNRDHRKIAVIDGDIGFTGGANIADEYINEISPYGHWKDTAVRIEGAAVTNLCAMFLQAFDMNAKQFSDYGQYLEVEHKTFGNGGYCHPFGDGPKPYYAEQVGENNYLNMINAAVDFVYISTPYLIIDHNIATALRNAAFRGVDVRIITPHIPDKKIIFSMTRSNYPYLMQAGVKIYEYTPGFIHAKMLVADGELAFVGTINLDYRSLVHHYECGAVIYKSPCVADITEDFEELFKVSEKIDPETFKIGKLSSIANSVLNLFSPML